MGKEGFFFFTDKIQRNALRFFFGLGKTAIAFLKGDSSCNNASPVHGLEILV